MNSQTDQQTPPYPWYDNRVKDLRQTLLTSWRGTRKILPINGGIPANPGLQSIGQ